ncbi:MAG: four helix bundle protein [Victivallales bacterium]|nr:four helix bundle protein [Victivallales bacterium]
MPESVGKNSRSTAKGPMLEKSKAFAVQIVRLSQSLVVERHEFVLSRQVLRSATSIGANLREARGAQSPADFLSKQSIALKEAYETEYWIELLGETGYLTSDSMDSLMKDASELISMLTKSVSSLKGKINNDNPGLILRDASAEYFWSDFTPPDSF